MSIFVRCSFTYYLSNSQNLSCRCMVWFFFVVLKVCNNLTDSPDELSTYSKIFSFVSYKNHVPYRDIFRTWLNSLSQKKKQNVHIVERIYFIHSQNNLNRTGKEVNFWFRLIFFVLPLVASFGIGCSREAIHLLTCYAMRIGGCFPSLVVVSVFDSTNVLW